MSLPPLLILLAAIGGVLLLGLADYAVGYEVGLLGFYSLPIAAASWMVGAPAGYAVALLSAGVCLAADWAAGHPYSHPVVALWEAAMRLGSFGLIALCVGKIRARQAAEEGQVASQPVKTLTGLLPICTTCKRIRNDQGSWEEIERYLVQHTEAQFTHGLCGSCAEKCLREAGLGPTSPGRGVDLSH